MDLGAEAFVLRRPEMPALLGELGLSDRQRSTTGARPLIYFNKGATCWQPDVKNLTVMENSIYNGWRMEDIWLDR